MTVAQFGRGAVPGPCCGSAMIHEPSPDPLAWEHARDQFVGSTLLSYSGTRRLACLRLCAWAAPGTPTIAKTAPTTTKPVSYTHLRAHETPEHLVCRLL